MENEEPVRGDVLRDLRESAGLTREQLAERVNQATGRHGEDALDVDTVRRMEERSISGSFMLKVRAVLKGQTTMPSSNGISPESAEAQIATSNAIKALAEYETLEADAQALAEEVNSTIAKLLSLGEPLRLALQARYGAFHRAVGAERYRAKLVGGESQEESIRIRAWRPIVRVPQGVIANLELNCEYSVSVVPRELDDSVLETRSEAFAYQPTAQDTPLSRRKGA